jgi:uncharacterized membrane protein
MKKILSKEQKSNGVFVAVILLIFSLLFFRAQYWIPGQEKERSILAIVLLTVTVSGTLASMFFHSILRSITSFRLKSRKLIIKIFSRCYQKKKILIISGISTSILEILTKIITIKKGIAYRDWFWFVLISAIIITGILLLYDKVGLHPEYLFLLSALSVGVLLIMITPPFLNGCWDEETHYHNTLEEVTFPSGYVSTSDTLLLQYQVDNVVNNIGFDEQSYKSFKSLVDEYPYRPMKFTYSFSTASISYIPEVIGQIIGRGLHLPFFWTYKLGKLFNLIFYCAVFSLAIKKVRYGKVLVSLIGLIPTSLYMATSYSYDPWLISLSTLGYSYLIEAVQSRKIKKASTKELCIGLIVLTIGIIPKAIYLFLLLPALLLPKDCFNSVNQKKKVQFVTVICMITLLLSFMVPFFASSASSAGDVRGGAGVNSSLQIQFILSQPFQYLKILLEFLNTYLSLNMANNYLVYYGYAGLGRLWISLLIVLVIIAVLDRSEELIAMMRIRIGVLVSCVLLVLLIPTALYISFTPVGSNSINGVQWRYLLPLLLPVLYFFLPDGYGSNRKKESLFVTVPILWYVVVSLINIIGVLIIRF